MYGAWYFDLIEMQLSKVDRQALLQFRQLDAGSSRRASDLMPSGIGAGVPVSFFCFPLLDPDV